MTHRTMSKHSYHEATSRSHSKLMSTTNASLNKPFPSFLSMKTGTRPCSMKMFQRFLLITSVSRNVETKGKVFWK